MLCQHFGSLFHQLKQSRIVLVEIIITSNILIHMIMGRDGLQRTGDSPLIHCQVSITNPRIQPQDISSTGFLHCFYQLATLLGGNMTGTVIDHCDSVTLPLDIHQIAAKSQLICPYFNAHTGRFKWRSACIIFLWLITEQGKIGDIASRRIALRNRLHKQQFSFFGQTVHCRGSGSLHRSLITKLGDRNIAHTVADQ